MARLKNLICHPQNKMGVRMDRKILLAAMVFLTVLSICAALPPMPHPVSGTVSDGDGATMVPSGTMVEVYDRDSGDIVRTQTWGPIPQLSGIYSLDVSGSTGDSIRARAWNATNFGETNTTLSATTTYADIDLNQTRDSETIVTLSWPRNYSTIEAGTLINVTADIELAGAQGTACFAQMLFSSQNVFRTNESTTISLGDISRGSSKMIIWNITANMTGTTNITVKAYCGSDGVNLLGLSNDTALDIAVADNYTPIISIYGPSNNTRLNSPVQFFYSVWDGSGIDECFIAVNGLIQDTVTNPPKNEMLNFTVPIATKTNWWHINCTDDSPSSRESMEGLYNLTINSLPEITLMTATDPVDLVIADNLTVNCNGTIRDLDGASDITELNATLFSSGTGVDEYDPDDAVDKHSNSSCVISGISGTDASFNCTFELPYFAVNGTWTCNVTLKDKINGTGSERLEVDVSELLAIDVTPEVLDYGNLRINQESPLDVPSSITNFGNVNLDIELYSYAETLDDGLGLKCTKGTILPSYERYSLAALQIWSDMTSMNGLAGKAVLDLDLAPRTAAAPSQDDVYWKISVPPGVGGRCDGKIVMTAIAG